LVIVIRLIPACIRRDSCGEVDDTGLATRRGRLSSAGGGARGGNYGGIDERGGQDYLSAFNNVVRAIDRDALVRVVERLRRARDHFGAADFVAQFLSPPAAR